MKEQPGQRTSPRRARTDDPLRLDKTRFTIEPGAFQPGRKRLRVDNCPTVTDVDQPEPGPPVRDCPIRI